MLMVGLIVGADGRSSLARKCLGLSDMRTYISSMAGVLLEDVDSIYEDYGHVILGGPGPVLACRIGPRRIRLFLDLPAGKIEKNPNALWNAFAQVLSPSWRESFRKALAARPVMWAANQWHPRVHYGRPGLALVGDAVGHYHPLTAVGLTLGFLDAWSLAECKTIAEYRRGRTAQSGVAELLAYSLYNVFSHDDPGTLALRKAVFQTWRHSPAECRRTMRLLAGNDTEVVQFNRAFLRILAKAGQQVLHDSFFSGHWFNAARVLGGLTKWVRWLATGRAAKSTRTRPAEKNATF